MGNIHDFGFPFTSMGADRQYSAEEWRHYFTAFTISGIVTNQGNELKVNPQGTPNKTVYVDTGAALLQGAMRIFTGTTNLTIADNSSGNPRIDRIVARLNYDDRKIELAVLQGTPASSPVAPSLTRDATAYEISLAKIAVANGFTTITSPEITDERADTTVCGAANFTLGVIPPSGADAETIMLSVETADRFGLKGTNATVDNALLAISSDIEKLTINSLLTSLQMAANSTNIDAWCDLFSDDSMINASESSNYLISGGQLKANNTFSGGSTGTGQYLGRDVYASKCCQSFTPAVSGELTSVTVSIYKAGTPTDDLICELYAGSSGVPTGSALASESISITGLPTSAGYTTITFSTPYTLVSEQEYCIVLSRSGALNGTNYLLVPMGTAANGLTRSAQKLDVGSWSAYGKYFDISCKISVTATVVWNSVTSSEILNRMAVVADQALGVGDVVSWYVSDDGTNWVEISNLRQMYDTGFDGTDVYLKCVLTGDAEVSAVAWGGI
jgi:hypothetical protein